MYFWLIANPTLASKPSDTILSIIIWREDPEYVPPVWASSLYWSACRSQDTRICNTLACNLVSHKVYTFTLQQRLLAIDAL